MGGPVGATSGKFILIGAALVLHGRVDDKAVPVAITPGAPTSAITPALSEWIKTHGSGTDIKIHLRAETFRTHVVAVDDQPAQKAEIRLGQDVLSDNPIEIDFAHHELQPLSASEARHFEQRAQPMVVHHEPDGMLSVDVAEGSRAPVRAVLDLQQATGLVLPGAIAGTPVNIGGVDVLKIDLEDGSKPLVGLNAFRRFSVLFDLGHDRIWIRR